MAPGVTAGLVGLYLGLAAGAALAVGTDQEFDANDDERTDGDAALERNGNHQL